MKPAIEYLAENSLPLQKYAISFSSAKTTEEKIKILRNALRSVKRRKDKASKQKDELAELHAKIEISVLTIELDAFLEDTNNGSGKYKTAQANK